MIFAITLYCLMKIFEPVGDIIGYSLWITYYYCSSPHSREFMVHIRVVVFNKYFDILTKFIPIVYITKQERPKIL